MSDDVQDEKSETEENKKENLKEFCDLSLQYHISDLVISEDRQKRTAIDYIAESLFKPSVPTPPPNFRA